MVFSSTVFLFIFLPVVFAGNILLPRKFRNVFLIAASLFFYAWGEPVYVLLMAASIIVNYFFGRSIAESSNRSKARIILTLSIIFNLALLVVFKYTNFIVDNLNSLTGLSLKVEEIRLPIGISFFTFHALSYVIDIYRDKSFFIRKLSNVALYISFFPQLIAGPIIKYHDITSQIEKRSLSPEKTLSGIRRFSVGLAKKLLIANTLGNVADMAFGINTGSLTGLEAWIGAVAYTLQIYFDFSGYSDMAIGLGRMFGFEIMENFNYPFIARSIKDFWRRWHISLTTWFREYVYYPLGGNRKGLKRTCINMFIIFLLTGFWHGALWTFLIWGLFHGFFLILETLGVIKTDKFRFKPLANIYTLLVVVTGFAIFRSDSLHQALSFLGAMFTEFSFSINNAGFAAAVQSPLILAAAAAALVASMPVIHDIRNRVSLNSLKSKVMEATGYVSAFILLILCMLALSSTTYNPFIYFRF